MTFDEVGSPTTILELLGSYCCSPYRLVFGASIFIAIATFFLLYNLLPLLCAAPSLDLHRAFFFPCRFSMSFSLTVATLPMQLELLPLLELHNFSLRSLLLYTHILFNQSLEEFHIIFDCSIKYHC